MTEETLFTPEEEQRIKEVLLIALRIDDERERESFIQEQCGNNRRMLDRVRTDIREALGGEDAQPSPLLKADEEIGNYRISEKIKRGGFATVYSAEHKILRTLAAIKIFDKPISEADKDLIWNKEGKSLSKFDHDNIVKFYDLGFYEKDGKRLPYVILELVKGKHLDDHCVAKDPPVREVLNLFRSLCSVIEYIHGKKNIFHLDLKPSNILVTASRPYRIKLIDFGSSRLFRNGPRRLTRNDFVNLLTLKFASPEQLGENEEVDHQSDIYSLGAVLYLLLTEKVPFGEGATNKEEIKREITNLKLPPILPSKRVFEIEKETKFGLSIKNLSKVLKGDLDFIVMKCLEKRRRYRYETVAELNQDLDRFLRGKPLKAKQKPFGYKLYKWSSRLFGFKGGLSGWARWKLPSQRFTIFGILLIFLGIAAGAVYRYFEPKSSSSVATPTSPEAKKAWDHGLEEAKKGNYKEAIRHINIAVTYESKFLYGHAALAAQYGNTEQWGAAAKSAKTAFDMFNSSQATEKEKLRANFFYSVFYTGNINNQLQVLQQWENQSAKDFRVSCNFSDVYLQSGDFLQAIEKAQDCRQINQGAGSSYINESMALIRLRRYDEARKVYQEALALNPPIDTVALHTGQYLIALIEGDNKSKQYNELLEAQSEWMKKHSFSYVLEDLEADREALRGHWRKSEEHSSNSISMASRIEEVKGVTPQYSARAALRGAAIEECKQVEDLAKDLPEEHNAVWATRTALALAMCGKPDLAKARANILEQPENDFKENTLAQELWLPIIKVAIALSGRGNEQAILDAIELSLSPNALRYEAAAEFWPQYVRGLAYLHLGDLTASAESKREYGKKALIEFKKITDNRSQAIGSVLYPLAHLGAARALKLQGNDAKEINDECKLFAGLWQTADKGLGILDKAKQICKEMK